MISDKKKIDYENIRPEDLTGEEIVFEVKLDNKIPAYCMDCHIEMGLTKIDVKRDNYTIKDVSAYKCSKCGKELLDVETASLVEREFSLINTH